MNAGEVVRVYLALQESSIQALLEGGWAVDAMVGVVRTHGDLDLLIEESHKAKATELIVSLGYEKTKDRSSKVNFEDSTSNLIELHLAHATDGRLIRETGNHTFNFNSKGEIGTLNGNSVYCVTAEELLEIYDCHRERKSHPSDKENKRLLRQYLKTKASRDASGATPP